MGSAESEGTRERDAEIECRKNVLSVEQKPEEDMTRAENERKVDEDRGEEVTRKKDRFE